MVDLKGLKFAKMHGIGNDFPIIDESREEQIPEADKPEACRQLCHRNFGVGGDGVLFVVPSEVADIGYRMFNPDGSEAEMCGNGIRCFGDFVYRNKIVEKDTMTVTCVSVGNPHAILFVDDVDAIDIDKYGPAIECHEAFPEKINVHFVEVISKNEGKMRTWERDLQV